MKISNELIECLNKVIVTAIEHGGDYGGAYFITPEKLYEATLNLIRTLDPSGKELELIWDTYTNKIDGNYRPALLTDAECNQLNASKEILEIRSKRELRPYDNTPFCKVICESYREAITKCAACQLSCSLAQPDCANKCKKYLTFLEECKKPQD